MIERLKDIMIVCLVVIVGLIAFILDRLIYRVKRILGITYEQQLIKTILKTQFAVRSDNKWHANSKEPDIYFTGYLKLT